ncbi:MAG TPA: twin-arginine translocation signal domain-containing protein, partial [Nitrospiria bacterium]
MGGGGRENRGIRKGAGTAIRNPFFTERSWNGFFSEIQDKKKTEGGKGLSQGVSRRNFLKLCGIVSALL